MQCSVLEGRMAPEEEPKKRLHGAVVATDLTSKKAKNTIGSHASSIPTGRSSLNMPSAVGIMHTPGKAFSKGCGGTISAV
jgi:hypothetical protein